MAKGRKTPENPQILDNDTPENDPSAAIRAINAAAGGGEEGDWVIEVRRVTGSPREGNKQPWLYDTTPDQLRTLNADLAQQFPEGGRFRVVARLNDRIYRSFFLDIEKRPGYVAPAARPWTAPQDGPAPAAAPAGDSRVLQVLQTMQDNQNRFMEMIATRLASPAPAPDPAAMMNTMFNNLRTFAELMPKPATDLGLSMFEKGFELASKVQGAGDGGGAGIMDIVREFVRSDEVKGVLVKLAAGAGSMPPPALQQQPPAPAPVFQNPRPVQQPPAPAPMGDTQDQLKGAIKMLLERARAGADPAQVADFLLMNLPEATLQELDKIDDLVSFCAGIDPEVNNHRPWFLALVENLTEADEDAPPDGNSGADSLAGHSETDS